MRPTYENEATLCAEARSGLVFARAFDCNLIKLPRSYSLDFMMVRDTLPVGWLELKNRSHSLQRYPTLILALQKFQAGLLLAQTTSLPFILAVQWTDAAGYCYASSLRPFPVLSFCGRTDRNDPADLEPCVEIPSQKFSLLVP